MIEVTGAHDRHIHIIKEQLVRCCHPPREQRSRCLLYA